MLPLDIIQFINKCHKREGKPAWRVRVEHRALANSFEFNKLLLNNDMTLETTAGYASKLNKIIERPNRDSHVTTRIAMGLTKDLPKYMWCFPREHVSFIKQRTCHYSIQLTLCYKWHGHPFD